MIIKKITMVLLSIILTGSAFALETKLPKVIEMEMFLTSEATKFLESRIASDKKIFVKASVEPMLRNKENQGAKEDLPYFVSEDDTVLDEWQVLETPVIVLLSRIKKANVTVELSADLTDSEYMDLKEKLFEHLKLVPMRDSIEIVKKPLIRKEQPKDYTMLMGIAGVVLIGFVGLYFSLKVSNKNTKTMEVATPQVASGPAPSFSMSGGGNKSTLKAISHGSISSKVQGDINFKDSIRAADMLKEKLHGIINAKIFPTLSDMLILEELASKKNSSFGAFVSEMPKKSQQQIFFKAPSDTWFKGYLEAGSVDLDCFMAVEKMLRARGSQSHEMMEELLIAVWRLGEEYAPSFLKMIDKEDAFSILMQLPKNYAVPFAKKTFPGNWARVLDGEMAKEISADNIDRYIKQATQLKPYYSFKSIDDYKKDLELLEYIKRSSLQDEEEIYESLKPDSHLFVIRPPFYKVLRAEQEELKNFVSNVELSQWALALYNTPKPMVKLISACLDDKKKYLLNSQIKQLDDMEFELEMQNLARENIALGFYNYQKNVIILNTIKKETKEEDHDEAV